jgi:hypothetical protein
MRGQQQQRRVQCVAQVHRQRGFQRRRERREVSHGLVQPSRGVQVPPRDEVVDEGRRGNDAVLEQLARAHAGHARHRHLRQRSDNALGMGSARRSAALAVGAARTSVL